MEENSPTEVLGKIEKRLDKASSEELKGWRFQQAKQDWQESPGDYLTRLLRYYVEAGLQEESSLIKKYVESTCNQGLKGLLEACVPPMTAIEAVEKAVPHYTEQLQKYVEAASSSNPRLLAGLGKR